MRNHCVFYRTNLKYDGRVCAIIRTLALSFPEDIVYLYEYPLNDEYFNDFPKNVKIIKSKLIFGTKRVNHLIQKIKGIIYAINCLCFLIKKKPKTIQVHHEVLMYGPLLYKLLNKRNVLVYNDEEMFFPRKKEHVKLKDKVEFKLIESSELVIITNEYRKKALFYLHRKKKIKDHIIVDNFVFEPNGKSLSSEILNKIKRIKQENKKILIHQGVINSTRGSELLVKVAKDIPDNWSLCFIGVKDNLYDIFLKELPENVKSNIQNLGYIPYDELNSFYKYVDASVIFYLPTSFNNNYCAPNRLYSAVNNGLPVIVNSDNYTLSVFIKQHQNGMSINQGSNLKRFFEHYNRFQDKAENMVGKYQYNKIIPQLFEYYKKL